MTARSAVAATLKPSPVRGANAYLRVASWARSRDALIGCVVKSVPPLIPDEPGGPATVSGSNTLRIVMSVTSSASTDPLRKRLSPPMLIAKLCSGFRNGFFCSRKALLLVDADGG